ncbi:MAG: immunity protein 32 [Pyrinomonadaceae bacterium]|nr:immunity protein 32 [Pyrinomonadaceae bacterium]
MLRVEIGLLENGDFSEEVEIYLDREGLNDLIARLSLIKDGKTEHIHLMSESWGLGDLSENKEKENNLLAHHLKIILTDG